MVPVALELEHAVDEVLEHPRAGDRAVLRHVADEEERDARPPCRRAAAAPRPRAPARPSRAPSRSRPSRASGPSRSRRRRAARARASRRPPRGSSRRGSRRCSAPPRRAARSFTCAVDSSPVTSSARRSREIAASAISRSVDFPTPGSPPTRTSEAGTRPPPSTRSSSGDARRDPLGLLDLDLGEPQQRLRARRCPFAAPAAPPRRACRSSPQLGTAAEPAAGRVAALGAGEVNGGSLRHAAESRSGIRRRMCRNRV